MPKHEKYCLATCPHYAHIKTERETLQMNVALNSLRILAVPSYILFGFGNARHEQQAIIRL